MMADEYYAAKRTAVTVGSFTQSSLDDHNITASPALQTLDFRKSVRFQKSRAQPETGWTPTLRTDRTLT
jgi:hypothetical protein